MIMAMSRQSACYLTTILAPLEILLFQQFAERVLSLKYTQTHKKTAQYRQIGPFPCVPNLSGLTTGNCRLETKLSLFLLFISRSKYTKATNRTTVLIRKKDSKVHSKPPKLHYTTAVYEAE